MKKAVTSTAAPTPFGAYSQAVVVNGFVYTAGFGPHDAANGNAIPEGIAEQTRQVLRNVEAVLIAAGAGLDDVVKTTVHLKYPERDFREFSATYGEFFTEPYPVRTTVGSNLVRMLVEIDVVARIPDADSA